MRSGLLCISAAVLVALLGSTSVTAQESSYIYRFNGKWSLSGGVVPATPLSADAPTFSFLRSGRPVAVTAQPTASGGTAPYSWVRDSGPAWLMISPEGVLSGTPTASGSHPFTLRVTDGAGGTRTVSGTATVAAALVAASNAPSNLYDATVGEELVSEPPTATNAAGTVTWDFATPSDGATAKPSWIAIDPMTGIFSGTPPAEETLSGLRLVATDSADGARSLSSAFGIDVKTPMTNVTAWGGGWLMMASNPIEPTEVPGTDVFSQLEIEESHGCGIAAGGVLKCWGHNGKGQVGSPSAGASSRTPVTVGSGYTYVTTGWNHACGLRSDGTIYCWGDNASGQLGIGTTSTQENSPRQVIDTDGDLFTAVSAAVNFTCAITVSTRVKCWGDNANGGLANGTTTGRATSPVYVTGTGFVQVAGGAYHACARTTSGGVRCWGNNADGKVGNGQTSGIQSSVYTLPTGTFGNFSSIATGATHTCGIGTDGILKCWGRNANGQVGTSGGGTRLTPVNLGTGYSSVAPGGSHTCAVTTGGDVRCWGFNGNGQLGNGGYWSQSSPSTVAYGGYTAVAASGNGTMALR